MKPTALLLLLIAAATAASAATKPVPSQCTADINSAYAAFVAAHAGGEAHQDNLMLCGRSLGPAYTQRAGRSGNTHHVLILSIPASGGSMNVEVDTNDTLDGIVTANPGDPVYVYGQAYIDPGAHRRFGFTVTAGIHEPHCATHRGADDGWIVVAGKKYPDHPCTGN